MCCCCSCLSVLVPLKTHQQLSIQESAILAKMADQYRMPHLAKGCTAVLDTKFASLAKAAEPDPKLLDWMLFADRYRIQSLVAWCEHLVIKHFPTVAQVCVLVGLCLQLVTHPPWCLSNTGPTAAAAQRTLLAGVLGMCSYVWALLHSFTLYSASQRGSAMQR